MEGEICNSELINCGTMILCWPKYAWSDRKESGEWEIETGAAKRPDLRGKIEGYYATMNSDVNHGTHDACKTHRHNRKLERGRRIDQSTNRITIM
jgi:hypothetical protein